MVVFDGTVTVARQRTATAPPARAAGEAVARLVVQFGEKISRLLVHGQLGRLAGRLLRS
jgi:hypothetical protein